jgi:hypothetical protein
MLAQHLSAARHNQQIMTLVEAISRAVTMLRVLTRCKAADGEFSIGEIQQMLAELSALQAALECAQAQIEAALEDAGGKDNADQRERVWCSRGGADGFRRRAEERPA